MTGHIVLFPLIYLTLVSEYLSCLNKITEISTPSLLVIIHDPVNEIGALSSIYRLRHLSVYLIDYFSGPPLVQPSTVSLI